MNIKRNLINFFIITILSSLAIINVKNPIKTKFLLFTSKIENISLGNLITIAFISGYSSSSLLILIAFNKNIKLKEDISSIDEEINTYKENEPEKNIKSDRPPERDIRESQPTISVNYRFIDPENIYKSNNGNSKKDKLVDDNNDWINIENEW